jgi:asparagine synthase (glutamine-hydrolysing)
MPLRYLILVGRRRSPVEPLARQMGERTNLDVAYLLGRVAILSSPSDAMLSLAADRGAILGTLFQKGVSSPRIRAMDDRDPPADLVAWLQERFWGDAVAVSRDPSGLLPCLYVVTPDLIAFGSDAALFEEASLLSPSIAWSALARMLYANELPQQRMALAGLTDLHAGTSVHIEYGGLRLSTRWSPWDFVARESAPSMTVLSGRAEETVDRCIESWAQDHRRLIVAVSGGLDSSIVASSLVKRKEAEVTALTISTQDSRGDESPYAKALCDHLGLPLICGQFEQSAVDILASACAHLPRLAGRAPTQAYDAVVRREMAQLGADAFLTGSGGDNVFYSTHSVRPLVDRYLTYGLHRGLITTARNIARLTDASLWSVLRFAARVPRTAGCKYRWPADNRFLSAEQVEANLAIPLKHPWLDAPRDALPGKSSHVAMILRAQHYLDNYDRRLPFTAVHPLLSQPIVEAMLAMPTWLAIDGGRDRAVARSAFSDRFPPVIVNRRIKGGPDGFAAQLLRANLPLARERLLDGAMCRHGILDRDALEASLTESALSRGHDFVRLLLLLDTEGWIDAWKR